MGASASINQIPEEILLEEANKTFRNSILSRELLSGLRRSSFSTFAPRTRILKEDIPSHVLHLLQKIGVGQHCDNLDQFSVLNSTTKLVGHIFECLGALQHLARCDPAENISASNSGSEQSSKAIGKLVHEMISLYGLCGDSLRVLLDANPDAAAVEDSFGRLPLHAAVDSNRPWTGAIESIIAAHPDGLLRRDGAGRLPLHIAVDRQSPCTDLVSLLVSECPEAAGARRGVGRLAIHYGMFCDNLSLQNLISLHEAFPDGVQSVDVYGRLPLHYAVDKAHPNLRIIKFLLDMYPEGATVADSHHRLPLVIAIDQEQICMPVIEILCKIFPAALERPGVNNRLPLHVAVGMINPSIPCVRHLAKLFPTAILLPITQVGKTSSALCIAKDKNDEDLIRSLLLYCKDSDIKLFYDLNWRARRAVFHLTKDISKSPSSNSDSPRRLSQLIIQIPSPLQNFNRELSISPLYPEHPSGNIFQWLMTTSEDLFRYVVSFM